jgi:four helix bundle protein
MVATQGAIRAIFARMGKTNGLHALEVAHLIIEEIHEAIKEFPTPDFSGLRYQLAKAANSVAANIAEGYGRDTDNERRNRLRTSRGELEETQSHLKVAGRLRYMQEKRFYRIWNLTVVLHRMLVQLMRKC